MALITWMAPVVTTDIVAGEPLPYPLYLASGVLLARRGQIIRDPDQLEVLRRQCWRGLAADETPPADAITLDEAALRLDRQPPVRFEPQPRPPLSDATALVADDMIVSQKLLVGLLRQQGVSQVVRAEDGEQAVNLFFRQRPHLAFLDIDMPGVDGIGALRQIKSWSPGTFVCLVTGNATLVNVKAAKSYGVDAFLVKPISGLNLKRVLSLYAPTAQSEERPGA